MGAALAALLLALPLPFPEELLPVSALKAATGEVSWLEAKASEYEGYVLT